MIELPRNYIVKLSWLEQEMRQRLGFFQKVQPFDSIRTVDEAISYIEIFRQYLNSPQYGTSKDRHFYYEKIRQFYDVPPFEFVFSEDCQR